MSSLCCSHILFYLLFSQTVYIITFRNRKFSLSYHHGSAVYIWYVKCILSTLKLTFSTEYRPSLEDNRFPASQEIPRIVWNPKVYYRIYKGPPHFPILSQINPIHASPSHFLEIHLNIIPIYAWFYKVVSFPQVSPSKPRIHLSSPNACYIPRPSHYFRFDQPKSI